MPLRGSRQQLLGSYGTDLLNLHFWHQMSLGMRRTVRGADAVVMTRLASLPTSLPIHEKEVCIAHHSAMHARLLGTTGARAEPKRPRFPRGHKVRPVHSHADRGATRYRQAGEDYALFALLVSRGPSVRPQHILLTVDVIPTAREISHVANNSYATFSQEYLRAVILCGWLEFLECG